MSIIVEVDGALVVGGVGTVVVAVSYDVASLGAAALLDVGTTVGTVAAGDDPRIAQKQQFVQYPAGEALPAYRAVGLRADGKVWLLHVTNQDNADPYDQELADNELYAALNYIGITTAAFAADELATLQVLGGIPVSNFPDFLDQGPVFTTAIDGKILSQDQLTLPQYIAVQIGIVQGGHLFLVGGGKFFIYIEENAAFEGRYYKYPALLSKVGEFNGGTGATNPTDARYNLQAAHMTGYAPYSANSPCDSPRGFYIDDDYIYAYTGSVWKRAPLQDWI